MFDHDAYRRYLEECGRRKVVALNASDWEGQEPPIPGQADPEYYSRIDSRRVTAQFAVPARPIDRGRKPITEAPLFGGEAQGNLFDDIEGGSK